MAHVLGIDIGGSGIMAAPVDTGTGKLVADRVKLATPQPSEREAVAAVVGDLVTTFDWTGPAGITFPGVVMDGTICTAVNLDPSWIGTDGRELFGTATGLPVTVLPAGLPATFALPVVDVSTSFRNPRKSA